MDALVDDGFVILGGPVGDGEQSLHVVKAADENEVKERLVPPRYRRTAPGRHDRALGALARQPRGELSRLTWR